MSYRLFFDLIQVSIGVRERLDIIPSEKDWASLFELGIRQSLDGVLFEGMSKYLPKVEGGKPDVFYEWLGAQQMVVAQNKLLNKRSKELYELFNGAGFRACVLKGQGTARYYPKPELRSCGDIDLWVDAERDNILGYVRTHNYIIENIDVQHSSILFFDDVPVEIHFLPSFMYSPLTNSRLQLFFKEKGQKQFGNYDKEVGFAHTTIDFDLVFSAVHIYRHLFSEGVGLRQLLDYYYIMMHATNSEKKEAMDILSKLGMKNFIGGLMWIMKDVFGMNKGLLMCPVNVRHGQFLIKEIMTSGNFGHYDSRIKRIDPSKRFQRGFVQFERNIRFVRYYPSEVLWSPFWKLWHWGWRKRKGYL